MRILLITSEAWNDKINGNNVLTNWFDGFDAEFAQIYCSPGEPLNSCCKKYFQLTDTTMLKSIIKRVPAGTVTDYDEYPNLDPTSNSLEKENQALYSRLKNITTETLRFIREMIWMFGKIDLVKLTEFINDFNPDIIFCPRMASIKLLKIEKLVQQITNKPMVAFTGDDEYTLRQFRISPVYWLKRFITRKMLRGNAKKYRCYYTLSDEQASDYNRIFHIPTKVLLKSGEFSLNKAHASVNTPINIVYAGKLYCNRWKNLARIGQALREINRSETKIILNIYTRDRVSKRQLKLLNDQKNSFLNEPVSPEKLKDIYDHADIALHVESFDLKNRLLTKLSFSTKIIDCLASGCSVLAMCWEKHTGIVYLKQHDAAILITSNDQVYPVLKEISENPQVILEYARKAAICGMENQQKSKIQEMMYTDFCKLIKDDTNESVAN